MKLTALELVRVLSALERFDEVDGDYIEDLQVKIVSQVNIEDKGLNIPNMLHTSKYCRTVNIT